jgi:hypothetical protein
MVASAVKEIRQDIKLAFITAFEINKSEFERVLPSTKVDAFIIKPIKSATFAEKIIIGITEYHSSNFHKVLKKSNVSSDTYRYRSIEPRILGINGTISTKWTISITTEAGEKATAIVETVGQRCQSGHNT